MRLFVGALALAGASARAADYAVVYEGAPQGFAEKLGKLTDLSLGRRPYPTPAAIRRAGRADMATVRQALVAGGYYAARVDFRVDASTARPTAIFEIDPGPLFRITRHEIRYVDAQAADERPQSFDAAEIPLSDAADGATLEANSTRFLAALWGDGYPAARAVARRAEALFDKGEASAVYEFETGPRATFGRLVVDGAQTTDTDYLESLAGWTEGERYDRAQLVKFREKLFETGNFASVEVEPGPPAEDGAAPIMLKIIERKRRTVGVGLTYSTTEGPGARAFLDYRNVFGAGELLRSEIAASKIEQSVGLTALKPLPRFPGSAFGGFSFRNETTDAYDARTFGADAGLSRLWFDERLDLRAVLALETSSVETKSVNSTLRDGVFYYVSAPVSATWNSESDLLRLEDGVRASLQVTPYAGTDAFTRLEATARSRIRFGADDRFTLAGRTRFAATIGSALASLPVNKRVYSGGGSSVRGYGYQAVGPIDIDGVPQGGRSAIEAALEARARIAGPFEIAGFIDAGAVTNQNFPRINGDYLAGAGGGIRYHSPIGPIRADVAFPLEKRLGDAGYQLYISIGQPF